MRWQQLFADLQAQFDEEEAAAERSESASRARAEMGAVRLSRAAARRARARRSCSPAGARARSPASWSTWARTGCCSRTTAGGRTWWRRRRSGRSPGSGRRDRRRSRPGRCGAGWTCAARCGALARDRAAVQVVLDDGGVLNGTLDRVGADYVELAEHPADLPRRAEAVQGVRAIVIAAVAVVRTVPPGLA